MLSQLTDKATPWFLIMVSTLSWTGLYYAIYSFNRKSEQSVRLVTVFHALTSICLCFYICVVKSTLPLFPQGVGLPNNWWHNLGMTYSLGYFLFDLVWSLYMQTENLVMLAHHVLSILGYLICFNMNLSACEILATTGGAEVSNPFLQLRWYLQQNQRLDSDVGKFAEHMFLLCWFVVRMGIGTLLYFVVVSSDVTFVVVKTGATGMFIISCTFTYGIIQYYRKKFGNLSLIPKYFVTEFPSFARSSWKNVLKLKLMSVS